MEKQGGTSIKTAGIMPVPNGFKLSSSSISSSNGSTTTFYNKDTIPFSSSSATRLISSTSSEELKSGKMTVVLSSHGNKCVMNGNKMLLSSSSLANSDKVITTTSSWGKATVAKSEARNGSMTISSSTAGVNDRASEKLRSNSNSVSTSADESSDQNDTFGDTSVFSMSSVGSMGVQRIADDSGPLSEGENSIDMFGATPAGKLIRQMIITEADSSDSILVPATQPVEDHSDQDPGCKIQIVVDSDQEHLDSPDSSVQHIYIEEEEEDFREDEILVAATQAVSQEPSDHRGSRMEIEESVVTDESSSSSPDDSYQAHGDQTFTVSPSPMKLSTKRFQKVGKQNITLKLGSVEEESSQPFNSTYVLNNAAQKENNNTKCGLRNNNCTFSRDASPVKDLGGDGTINSLQNSSDLDENISQMQQPSLFCSLSESQSSILEGAPQEASNLDATVAPNQVDPLAQNEAVGIAQDQVEPNAQDHVDPVDQYQVVPLAQNQAGPKAPNEVEDPTIARNKLNLNAVKENVPPPMPSTPNALPLHVIQLSTTPSSPRKGKKLYKEPSFPVKETAAPKSPKSPDSSDSEAEQDGEQSLYSRFPHLNNPKRGKDTKADREALFETENPLPSTSAPLLRHNAREEKRKSKGKVVNKSESSQVSSKERRTVRHASKNRVDSKAAKVSQANSVHTKPKRTKKKKETAEEDEPDCQARDSVAQAVVKPSPVQFIDQAFLVKPTGKTQLSKLQTEGAPVHGDAENPEHEMPHLEIASDNRIPAEAKTIDKQTAPSLQIEQDPEGEVKQKKPRGRPPLKAKKKPVASKTQRESNNAYLEELPDLSDEAFSDHPTPTDIPVAKTTKGRPKRKKHDIVDLTDEPQEASAAKKTKELHQLILELEPAPPTPPKSKSDQEKKEEKYDQENGEKSDRINGEKSDGEDGEKSDGEKQEHNEEAVSSRPKTKRLQKASSSDNKLVVPEMKKRGKVGKQPVEIVLSTSPPPPTPPKPKYEQDNDAVSSRPTTKRVRKPSTSEDKTAPEVKKSKKGSKKPTEITISSSPPPPTPPRGRNPRKNNHKKDVVPAQEPVAIVHDNNQEVRRSGRARKPRNFGEGFFPFPY